MGGGGDGVLGERWEERVDGGGGEGGRKENETRNSFE